MNTLAGFVAGFILGGAVVAGAQFYPGMPDAQRDLGLQQLYQQQQEQLQLQRQLQMQQSLRPC